MGVLLQGFYKLGPKRAVPSPADGDSKTPWWWDHLAAQANDFRTAGFTAIWLPPVLKTSAGVHPDADGYGPFDDYDIGSKRQMGSVPTRFGSREQLQRCVATFRASGLDVYLDMVEHHRSGDPGNFVFRYRGADGTPTTGRFPKDPLNFVPTCRAIPTSAGQPRTISRLGASSRR
jgi:alpha-amylase